MHYYGTTKVAFRASAESMCGLSALRYKWNPLSIDDDRNESYTYTEFDVFNDDILPELSLEKFSKLNPDKVVVATFSVDTELLLLSTLERIAQERPEIEIAVAAEAIISTCDSVVYCSYFSAVGENTIHPDEFQSFCHDRVKIQTSVMDHNGKSLNFNLANIPDIDKASFGGAELSSMPDEDIYYVFCDESYWYLPLILRHDTNGSWNWICDCGNYYRVEDKIKMLEEKYHIEEEGSFEALLSCNTRIEDLPRCPEEFLLQAMNVLCPELKLHVEMLKELPHLLDDKGNEYFFGSMLNVDNTNFREIDWGFPKDATWIPF